MYKYSEGFIFRSSYNAWCVPTFVTLSSSIGRPNVTRPQDGRLHTARLARYTIIYRVIPLHCITVFSVKCFPIRFPIRIRPATYRTNAILFSYIRLTNVHTLHCVCVRNEWKNKFGIIVAREPRETPCTRITLRRYIAAAILVCVGMRNRAVAYSYYMKSAATKTKLNAPYTYDKIK